MNVDHGCTTLQLKLLPKVATCIHVATIRQLKLISTKLPESCSVYARLKGATRVLYPLKRVFMYTLNVCSQVEHLRVDRRDAAVDDMLIQYIVFLPFLVQQVKMKSMMVLSFTFMALMGMLNSM